MDNNLNCEKLSQKEEQRFQAVFAMLKGEFISDIVEKHKICRSDLYKFRKRALIAMREAMYDLPREVQKLPITVFLKQKKCKGHFDVSHCVA